MAAASDGSSTTSTTMGSCSRSAARRSAWSASIPVPAKLYGDVRGFHAPPRSSRPPAARTCPAARAIWSSTAQGPAQSTRFPPPRTTSGLPSVRSPITTILGWASRRGCPEGGSITSSTPASCSSRTRAAGPRGTPRAWASIATRPLPSTRRAPAPSRASSASMAAACAIDAPCARRTITRPPRRPCTARRAERPIRSG